MELRFNFELKENPYKDDSSKYLIWGRILLLLDDKIIIDYQWDILEVIEWFFSKKEYLLKELLFEKNGFQSIVEIRNHLYDCVDDMTPLNYIEKFEDYFFNHTFRLKGTPLGTYYLGLFNNKLGQISFEKNDVIYYFDFDMIRFVTSTDLIICDILKQWNTSPYKTIQALSKIENLQKIYNFK